MLTAGWYSVSDMPWVGKITWHCHTCPAPYSLQISTPLPRAGISGFLVCCEGKI